MAQFFQFHSFNSFFPSVPIIKTICIWKEIPKKQEEKEL